MATEERRFPAGRTEVPAIRHWVTNLAERAGFSTVVPDLALAVSEAVSNAVRHSGSRSLVVRWTATDDEAVVEVRDEGIFPERAIYPHEVGGFGLPIMTAVMDEVSIERGSGQQPGTTIRLVKKKR